jgi:hypothetical protein
LFHAVLAEGIRAKKERGLSRMNLLSPSLTVGVKQPLMIVSPLAAESIRAPSSKGDRLHLSTLWVGFY